MMMPWLILGVFKSYFFRVYTVCAIDSLFVGRSIFVWLLEGEAVVIDDALVLKSYFFSRLVNNGDIEHLAHRAQGS